MRRGFLAGLDTPNSRPKSSSAKAPQHPTKRMPLAHIRPPPVSVADSAPPTTLTPIPNGHVGCCERVGLSELLKILRNAGENTPPPQPVIFQVPSKASQPDETITTCITIPEAREKLLSKGPYPAIDAQKDVDKIIGVLRTNNWGIGALPGHDAPYGGTGAIISRINHSCAPNALFRWNEELFAAEVRALRPIRRGEEVTIGHASRQERLRDAYGFTCTCELCARPAPARALSDGLRAQLEGLTSHGDELPDARLWAWARDTRARDDALLGALEQQVAIMEQELYVRPEGWLAVARALVKIYCALGNTVAARRWAVCAASYTRAATGTDGGWEAVARNPEQTVWWGVRVKAGLR
ncbi:hypothetical protein EDB84DRAFT_1516300 [Lactarius hengduanensis]|nr:hypothetical protein EDB84DRAFT_1516300 [Lactarius hengduanensis]